MRIIYKFLNRFHYCCWSLGIYLLSQYYFSMTSDNWITQHSQFGSMNKGQSKLYSIESFIFRQIKLFLQFIIQCKKSMNESTSNLIPSFLNWHPLPYFSLIGCSQLLDSYGTHMSMWSPLSSNGCGQLKSSILKSMIVLPSSFLFNK